MNHYENRAVATVKELQAAGVEFGYRTFDPRTGKTIELTLNEMVTRPTETWDADFTPTFPVLPESHPHFAAVEQARQKWSTDPRFRSVLDNGYGLIQMADCEDFDWDTPS